MFGVAVVSKLSDRDGTRKAMLAFGVPTSAAGAASLILPLIEIAVAIGLLFNLTAWFAAIASIVLLSVFTLAIVVQLSKGNAPDCHCFGQLSSEKIGISTVFRNLVFVAPAVALVYRGQSGQGGELTGLYRDDVLLILVLTAVLLLGFAIDMLRRVSSKQDEFARRLDLLDLASVEATTVERDQAGSPHDGLPIGAMLPSYELFDTDKNVIESSNLIGDGRGALLLFVGPNCAPCKALVPKFREWVADLIPKMNVYLISSGSADENIKKFGDTPLTPLLLQNGRALATSVGAKWTPSAIYVNSNGRISSHPAAGDSAIAELVEQLVVSDLGDEYAHFTVANGNGGHSNVNIGDEIPEFDVRSISGDEITSRSIRGSQTLIAFWNDTCPHCVRMLPEFKRWDEKKNGDDVADIKQV